jgi:hypothetical protein
MIRNQSFYIDNILYFWPLPRQTPDKLDQEQNHARRCDQQRAIPHSLSMQPFYSVDRASSNRVFHIFPYIRNSAERPAPASQRGTRLSPSVPKYATKARRDVRQSVRSPAGATATGPLRKANRAGLRPAAHHPPAARAHHPPAKTAPADGFARICRQGRRQKARRACHRQ